MSLLIQDMKIEKIDADQYRLLIDLKERVPYRIKNENNSAIVELNHIQKIPGKYVFDPEAKRELENAPSRVSYLTNIGVFEKKDTGYTLKIIREFTETD